MFFKDFIRNPQTTIALTFLTHIISGIDGVIPFNSGEVIENGWPLILTMIGSLEQDHSDILVRSAFQCLQLVFTDFLPAIPYRCYPICVETATKFGSQKAELNVSLAAIGLLWNLSDYFFQVLYLKFRLSEKHTVFQKIFLMVKTFTKSM